MNPVVNNTIQWAAAAAAAPGGAQPNDLSPLLFMFVMIGLLFYLLIARPNRQQEKRRQAMLDAVAKGDTVVTSGGILGTVESVDSAKGVVAIKVAPKVTMDFTKASIASVTPRKSKGSENEAKTA